MIESTHFSPVFWIASDSREEPISRDEVGNQFYRITELLELRGLDSLGETNSEEELNYLVPPSVFQF